jgi:ubiquinone/menaquinone biosynthesis C-methylase UbiE
VFNNTFLGGIASPKHKGTAASKESIVGNHSRSDDIEPEPSPTEKPQNQLQNDPLADPALKFSERARDYAMHRPSYPAEVIELLREHAGLKPSHVVADVGAGTGISTVLFLDNQNVTYAIEPNAEMRRICHRELGGDPNIVVVDGRAEATTLKDHSIDLVTAFQAFHWFDHDAFLAESKRILKSTGKVALVWNERSIDCDDFHRQYEAMLDEHGIDYAKNKHSFIPDDIRIAKYFGGNEFECFELYNEQVLNFAQLKGRLLSCSYAPKPSHPDFGFMLGHLAFLFYQNEVDGYVTMVYKTKVYVGTPA